MENAPIFSNVSKSNLVEQWGFEIGCSVSVECWQNKLVIVKG